MNAPREEISLSLRRRLEEAQAAYQRATTEYRRLTSISAATEHPEDPGLVDGTFALRQAMRLHRHARLKYERALKEFTDFILSGKMPPGPQA
ncbi:MAG: hypothetical protein C5B51_18875 [Terriglobia bacterium]|nr:MAG: hypothetical protein C5B51_18875 [Terriglobia bacterium]